MEVRLYHRETTRTEKEPQAKETPAEAEGRDRGLAKSADASNGPSGGGQWQGSARPLNPSSTRRPGDLAYWAEVPHASRRLRQ